MYRIPGGALERQRPVLFYPVEYAEREAVFVRDVVRDVVRDIRRKDAVLTAVRSFL